jgi:nucleotide-binding universal stress UspA family protein
MLLCLDLEKGSRALARYAAKLARRCGQDIHLFYVGPSGGSPVIKNPRARLEAIAAETMQGSNVEAIILRQGLAEDEIIAYAKGCTIAPIVIGRRQRSAVERIYVGSTTSAVLSLTSCPVLVVPLSNKEIRP